MSEYNMVMEYSRMNGDGSYNEQMAQKMKVHQEAGIDGVCLTELSLRGLWEEMFVERIEQILEGELRETRRHRRNEF
jgi:hypothetical protein